ncbi:MAG: acylphosphatase [Spirochaetota bacterium]|nr:acylphosphatase [Spirochaetota bacterium]
MAKELILSGRVQGVFCRNYCSKIGIKLGIKGSATNLSDGTVQVLLLCDDKMVKTYVKTLKENTFNLRFYGQIKNVEIHNYSGSIKGDYTF